MHQNGGNFYRVLLTPLQHHKVIQAGREPGKRGPAGGRGTERLQRVAQGFIWSHCETLQGQELVSLEQPVPGLGCLQGKSFSQWLAGSISAYFASLHHAPLRRPRPRPPL